METETHTTKTHMVGSERISLLLIRATVFIVGLFVMSLGIVAIVKAHFGVSPWDVLHLGIVKHSSLSFGRVQQLVGVVILIVAGLLLKKWPTVGAVANMILVGEFSDLILRLQLVPTLESGVARAVLLTIGIIVMGFGTGIYIESRLGAGPRDWLMLALHDKTGIAIRWVRTGLEVFAVGFGLWLGGPFAVGTIIFSLTIGHVTEYGLRVARGLLGRYTKGSDPV